MSSRSTQIVGGPSREHAHVDAATNALLVKVVNPGGGSGTVVQYNEDTAHVNGDTGTMSLAVRNDAGTSLVGADGDYAPLQVDSTGALRVTGGGGGTQYQEDAAHASGATGTLSLVVRNDTPGSLTSTDGDYAPLQVDSTGRLRVSVDSSVAVAVTDNGGSLTVDGSVAATQSGAWAVSVTGLVDVSGSTVAVSNFPSVYPVNDNGGSLTVDGTVAISGSVAVTDGGGSLTVDGTVAVSNFPATTTVVQATHDNLNANANIQIGDADVGAANPVPISDNGGSLTVDGTVAATQSGAWTVGVSNFPSVYPVNDNGGSLTVDGTVSVSGTVAVTQSGAWSVTADTGLGKAEDAAHTTGDTGVMALAVRQDTAAALAGTTGDYSPLSVDARAHLRTVIGDWEDGVGMSVFLQSDAVTLDAAAPGLSLLTVDPRAHDATVGVEDELYLALRDKAGYLQVAGIIRDCDDPVHQALNLATTDLAANGTECGIPVMSRRRDSLLTDLTSADGDWQPFVSDSKGRLIVTFAGGTPNFNVWYDDAPVTTADPLPVTIGASATGIGKAEDAAHTTGDVGAFVLAVRTDTPTARAGTDGDYIPFITDSSGRLHVTVGSQTLQCEVLSGGSSISILNPLQVVSASLGLPGTSASSLGKAEDAAHSTGDVGVMSLAVRNDTPSSLAGSNGDYIPLTTDSVGALHVNVRTGTIATVSSVSAVIAGTGATNLGKAEDAAHTTGATGVMALAVRNDTVSALATTNGDYIPLTTDSLGRLWSNVNVITPGTAAANLGKAEDEAHASGDVGVMALAVRQDTLASLSGTTGDYTPFSVDSLGRLYVREAGVTTIALSGSTRGRPIQITATGSPGTTLHTATTTTGQLDRIYIYLTNTSSAAVTVTIEFGTTGAGSEMDVIVPANETILAVDGAVIGGAATDTIAAYASTGSVVNAFGRVERLT